MPFWEMPSAFVWPYGVNGASPHAALDNLSAPGLVAGAACFSGSVAGKRSAARRRQLTGDPRQLAGGAVVAEGGHAGARTAPRPEAQTTGVCFGGPSVAADTECRWAKPCREAKRHVAAQCRVSEATYCRDEECQRVNNIVERAHGEFSSMESLGSRCLPFPAP